MALAVVEMLVATSRVTGEEKIRLDLKDGLMLECTAIAGTSPRKPVFSLDESSWTQEIREGFRSLTAENAKHLKQGERAPKKRFVRITSEIHHGVPLELTLSASFGYDPQLHHHTMTFAPIIGVELV